MKLIKVFILITTTVGLFLGVSAHPVDQETARAVAVKFMKTTDLTTADTYSTSDGTPALFTFNTTDGFVIVAADDCETPIIGYSHEGRFNPDDVPVQMQEYLQDFVARIQYGIENQIVADEVTARQWELVKATGRLNDNRSAKAMEPLITTKWHQGCLYNSLCPEMSGPCGHAEVGCVAVAMAQIMNYWSFPAVGNGSTSYYSSNGELLSANFGSTQYQWNIMPDALSDTTSPVQVKAVATLLYHCGVAVNMVYTNNGSGAHSYDVPDALTHHFYYAKEMHRETMGNEPEQWLLKLKDCLDNERPVFYSGQGSGGHAFVCDGYDENDFLHFNWGWGGNGDGYYSLGSLNPLGHNYNSSNGAIFDIVPDNTPVSITATANPPYGGSIEGTGSYLPWEPCVLTASPVENYEFLYWKKNDQIVSYENPYPLVLNENENDNEYEAVFNLKSVQTITANTSDENLASVTWSFQNIGQWPLLEHFNIDKVQSIATDGNRIYLCKWDSKNFFWEYSLDGLYIKKWEHGIGFPTSLTYDGELFYCNRNSNAYLYSYDMTSNSPVSFVRTGYTPICSYDPVCDGLWIALYYSPKQAYKLQLIDRTGAIIKQGPILPSKVTPNGSGFIVGEDRDSHLIIKDLAGVVYDYDIDQDHFHQCNVDLGRSFGTYIGDYKGKTAMYVCFDEEVKLYDIKNSIRFWPITCYRLYRSDEKGNVTLLSDQASGNSYTDTTWDELEVGLYRFGISSVFANGNESEIVWSNALAKGNYGIDEILDSEETLVQKVVENGQIIIIKEGRKYNVTGQEITSP